MGGPLLSIQDYTISFRIPEGEIRAVRNMDLSINPGEKLAIVGESGSGKSQTFLGVMGLLAKNAHVSGQAQFMGQELLGLAARKLDKIRGRDMTMVFQDPMSALNPVLRISRQLSEPLEVHFGMRRKEAEQQAIAMLEKVGIPDPARRFRLYPHELSGGQRQRVVIAMALLTKPKLLIADEPTTALDVTIQAQILDLFQALTKDMGTALVMISHDLGVVAGLVDRVVVMYAGRIVEDAPVEDIFTKPAHPYTEALLKAIPRLDRSDQDITPIPGRPPDLMQLPAGCAFAPRCTHVSEQCHRVPPDLETLAATRKAACHTPLLNKGVA